MSKLGKLFLIPNVLSAGTASEVIPLEVRKAVDQTNYFFAEDIRTGRRFLSELKIGRPIESLHFFLLNKDSSKEEMGKDWASIPEEENIGMISEAGCPGVADPGALLVEYAHKMQRQVVPLVGPSSILLALMASGFNGQSFTFHGYIPIDKDARIKALKSLEKSAFEKNQTQIFIETPYRNNKLLEDILQQCKPQTKLCLAVDLGSDQQFIGSRSISDWKKEVPDLNKKPTVFLLFH